MQLYWVDAFATELFRGNPAGVVPLDSWPPETLMRSIAFENGLAETAFFVRTGPARFKLRWFTPTAEVDLCGHATLATAHVVFTQLGEPGREITFDSRSGPLVVRKLQDGALELDFPALATSPVADDALVKRVEDAIGARVTSLGRTPFDLLAVLESAQTIRALRPDIAKIDALGGRGLIVTAKGDAGADFVSRFFAPQVGVPEDPVTGSAHCALVPYWSRQLGRTSLTAHQLSPRGGVLACRLDGGRVRLAGHATLYLRGELMIGK
jgi:PhzF family phenazine biosynthesis protein